MNDRKLPEGIRHEAEDTLRLLAVLPAPEDLTDRVHARLQAARLQAEYATAAKRGFWAYWMPAQRLQFAGAAALVLAVVGSTWTVYRSHSQAVPVRPVAQPAAGFGTAGTVRVPPTLHPILVPARPKAAAHRKPGAGRAAIPSAPKLPVVAAPAAANP